MVTSVTEFLEHRMINLSFYCFIKYNEKNTRIFPGRGQSYGGKKKIFL